MVLKFQGRGYSLVDLLVLDCSDRKKKVEPAVKDGRLPFAVLGFEDNIFAGVRYGDDWIVYCESRKSRESVARISNGLSDVSAQGFMTQEELDRMKDLAYDLADYPDKSPRFLNAEERIAKMKREKKIADSVGKPLEYKLKITF